MGHMHTIGLRRSKMAHGNQGKLKNNKVLNDYPSRQDECEECTKLLNGMLFMK